MKILQRPYGATTINVIDTKPDGNCLCRSLAQRLKTLKKLDDTDDTLHEEIRFQCFAFIFEHQDEFKQQIIYNVDDKNQDEGRASNATDDEKLMEGLNDIATVGQFCGEEIVKAFSEVYGMEVTVYNEAGYQVDFVPGPETLSSTEVIKIYYSRKHYETVATSKELKAIKQREKIMNDPEKLKSYRLKGIERMKKSRANRMIKCEFNNYCFQ